MSRSRRPSRVAFDADGVVPAPVVKQVEQRRDGESGIGAEPPSHDRRSRGEPFPWPRAIAMVLFAALFITEHAALPIQGALPHRVSPHAEAEHPRPHGHLLPVRRDQLAGGPRPHNRPTKGQDHRESANGLHERRSWSSS